MKIDSVLTDYFCKKYSIDLQKDYVIEYIDAKELLVPERIDLVAKIKYIEFREKGYDLSFAKEVYTAHIEAFSHGTFKEPGNNEKNSIEKYYDTFNKLIDQIKLNGLNEEISVIPVGKNNAILDGAHRVAIAFYFGKRIPIIRFDNISVTYDTDYFIDNLLSRKYMDFLVTEYCKLKENTYFMCLWPKGNKESKRSSIDNIIKENHKVIYKKSISLNYNGFRNLITQVYAAHDWVGSYQNHFVGARKKIDACYTDPGSITIFIFESEKFDSVLDLKQQIREIINVGKHSVHITDNQFETVQIANLLLNENSVEFLNLGKPDKYPKFNENLKTFKNVLEKNEQPFEDYLIVSSSILALYGLRDAEDIDFISISKNFGIIESQIINNHNSYIQLYDTTLENVILNPRYYFTYNDLKFVDINMLKKFKRNRNEKKDQIDLKLITSIINEKSNFYKKTRFKLESFYYRKKRNITYICKTTAGKVLRKIGLYTRVKKFIKVIKSK